ncbi:MAG: hypothetical protein ACR2FR_04935 [Rubrobacter sp.]
MINELLIDPDDGSVEPELYFIRRKGTAGLTRALRRKIAPNGSMVCLYLFYDQLSAFEYLGLLGLNPDEWEFASSREVGGIASLLKKASKLSIPTPTHMLINPPTVYAPLLAQTIEDAIDYYGSSTWAEQWKSGGPKPPFWLLGNEAQRYVLVIPIPGGKAVCLFKTEMDAEGFRQSGRVSADEWKSDGPVDSARGVLSLKEFSYLGLSYAVINPPPGNTGSLKRLV